MNISPALQRARHRAVTRRLQTTPSLDFTTSEKGRQDLLLIEAEETLLVRADLVNVHMVVISIEEALNTLDMPAGVRPTDNRFGDVVLAQIPYRVLKQPRRFQLPTEVALQTRGDHYYKLKSPAERLASATRVLRAYSAVRDVLDNPSVLEPVLRDMAKELRVPYAALLEAVGARSPTCGVTLADKRVFLRWNAKHGEKAQQKGVA
jgi:hypothetical protein